MSYFDGLVFIGADEVPDCRIQLGDYCEDALALNFLWQGQIHFRTEGRPSERLKGPMIYWTLPGKRYSYGNVPGEGWHQLWVLVRGQRVEAMLLGGLVPRTETPWSVPGDSEAFLADLRVLVRMVRGARAGDAARMTALLERLFLEASLPSPASERDGGTARERVRRLAEHVAGEPAKPWDFAREAKQSGMSYPHFRRLFCAETGHGPTDYLLDCRLRDAAARLRGGAPSVKAAAYAAGFRDAHSLARLMRQRLGVMPSELRTR